MYLRLGRDTGVWASARRQDTAAWLTKNSKAEKTLSGRTGPNMAGKQKAEQREEFCPNLQPLKTICDCH